MSGRWRRGMAMCEVSCVRVHLVNEGLCRQLLEGRTFELIRTCDSYSLSDLPSLLCHYKPGKGTSVIKDPSLSGSSLGRVIAYATCRQSMVTQCVLCCQTISFHRSQYMRKMPSPSQASNIRAERNVFKVPTEIE